MTEIPPRIDPLPKVTIAIPTLNRVEYLRLALQSALSQTYANIEVIVSNNASTDDTASYLNTCTDPRLQVLHQTSLLPMTENWNACLAAATGQYFLLLSDDDLLEPDAIRELVAGYAQQDGLPPPGIVYCGGWIIDSNGDVVRIFKDSPHREAARDLIPAFFDGNRDLWLCGILFRTAEALPGFSTEYNWAPDSKLWIQSVIKFGAAIFIQSDLVRYRVHLNATSSLPLQVWKHEITRLGQFAVEQYNLIHGNDRQFSLSVHKAIRRLKMRTIPHKINQSFGSRKISALCEYGRQLPNFLGLYGIRFLVGGIASLILKEQSKTWLLNVLRKRPQPANRP
jgi:glycosyltransferase involved in cell wall biosynthesis